MDPTRTPLTIGQEMTLAWTRMYSSMMTNALGWHRGNANHIKTHAYGTHADECLDIMTTDEPASGSAIIFIHGGGWTMGSKDAYRDDLEPLREAGRTVFNIEYPKAPERPHPFMLGSILSALQWIKREQGISHAHLVGDSAGGTLAVMAALIILNKSLRSPLGPIYADLDTPVIASVSSLYGVLDRQSCFDKHVPGGSAMLAAYGGQEVLRQTVDADHAITPMDLEFTNHPPCFLAVGGDDVLRASSELYRDRLVKEDFPHHYKSYDGAVHGFLSSTFDPQRAELLNDILDFISEFDAP